jgi:hypothetical protein
MASYFMRGFHAFMRETDATRSRRNRDEFKILEKTPTNDRTDEEAIRGRRTADSYFVRVKSE